MSISPMLLVLLTLLGLELKHFLCDFVYQTKYMLGKSNARNWRGPLLTHALVHGLATLAVLAVPGYLIGDLSLVVWLAVADGLLHCVIDGIKSRCFRANIFHHRYWVILGLDQFLHSVTYILIAAVIAAQLI